MARLLSRIEIAKADIIKFFDESARRVYTKSELTRVLTSNRGFWQLTQSTGTNYFISFLMEKSKLTEIKLASANYSGFVRYAWGEVSAYQVALSVKPRTYLSHGTAVSLHGLSDQVPKTIYANQEQSPKPAPKGELTQGAIDRAFSNQQRSSGYVLEYEQMADCSAERQKHGNLGVVKIEGPLHEQLDATSVERTLIDLAIAPFTPEAFFKFLKPTCPREMSFREYAHSHLKEAQLCLSLPSNHRLLHATGGL